MAGVRTHIATSCGATVAVCGSATPSILVPLKASVMSHLDTDQRDGGISSFVSVSTFERLPSRLASTAVAHDGSVDDFVIRLIEDRGYREACVDALGEGAVAFGYPYKVVAG